MRILFYTTVSFLGVFACVLLPVRAAELYVAPGATTVLVGQNFEVAVQLHSDNQEINAVEGTFYYPSSLELTAISTKNSFITFWIQSPQKVASNRAGFNAIRMSGLTPGGVAVAGANLATLQFTVPANAPNTNILLFTLDNVRVLLNDGQGTPAPVTIKNATLRVSDTPASVASTTFSASTTMLDSTAPEPFSVAITRNQNLFDNHWFAVFVARDIGDGIDHYEMQESQKNTPNESAWVTVVNPAILKDQTRGSYIFVKAVDKAGNKTVVRVSPQNNEYSYSKLLFWCILLLAVFVLMVRTFLLNRQKKENEKTPL